MFGYYTHTMIEWAQGELNDDQFRAATQYGMCLMLLGLARGRAQRALARRLRAVAPAVAPANRTRARARKGG
jgi:hypothetical protein